MSEYRVALRHTTLLESIALEDADNDRHFIATTAPPPTNSILTLERDGETKYFLVDRVFEVASADQRQGVMGTLADADAHREASMMGTEHLDDGESPADSTPAMAMPAPVVNPDGGDEALDAEPDGDETTLAENERSDESDAEDASASADGDGADSDSTEDTESKPNGGRRGRRRRGRRRR